MSPIFTNSKFHFIFQIYFIKERNKFQRLSGIWCSLFRIKNKLYSPPEERTR